MRDISSVDSFDNTEIAFAAKSNWQLKKANYLFKIVNNNAMASIATFGAKMALNLRLPVKGMIKATVFEHFCGGETIDECKQTSERMAKFKIGSVLDYSVEGKDTEEAFDHAMEETLKTIENAKDNSNVPYSVFKPTGIGSHEIMEKVALGEKLTDDEHKSFERLKDRYSVLSKTAYDYGVRLLVDAEETWYQQTIDDILYDLMEKYNKERAIVFNTYQMYRWDSVDLIKNGHKLAQEKGFVLGAKLVRGAYMERERARAEEKGYADPICKDKPHTDQCYNDGLKYCVENVDMIELFNGTHNEYSNYYLTELMTKAGLERDDSRIWSVQLFGMSDNISFVMADAGYNVAKYMPYGPVKHVMPYLIRRAKENTSVGGQSSRELTMLSNELKRRKAAK